MIEEPDIERTMIVSMEKPCYCVKLKRNKKCTHGVYHYHANYPVCSECGKVLTEQEIWD